MAEYKKSDHHHHKSGKATRHQGGKIASHMPAGAELSPSGDIGAKRDAEQHKVGQVFAGGYMSKGYLPFRREKMQGDGGEGVMTLLPCREFSKDEVV